MFSLSDDASKVAFVWLARQVHSWGFDLIDCQMSTAHLRRFGAEDYPRARFLEALEASLKSRTRRRLWRFDEGFSPWESAPEPR